MLRIRPLIAVASLIAIIGAAPPTAEAAPEASPPAAADRIKAIPAEPLAADRICCIASEVQTLRDLIYVASVANPPADVKQRLIALNAALVTGTWPTWDDADRGLILGYIAATPDGIYWRGLLDSFAARIGVSIKAVGSSVNPPPPSVVIPSSSTAGTVAPLSAQQISDVIQFASDAVSSGFMSASVRESIRAQLNAGIYAYADRVIIDALKLWYYSGNAGANKSAAYAYLAIIDQRDPNNTSITLAIDDPRWKRVGGSSTVVERPNPPPASGTSGAITNLSADQVRAIIAEELAKLPAVGAGSVASDATGGGHYAALAAGAVDLRANTLRNATQDGITAEYRGTIQMNGWDGGLRECQNYQWIGTSELPYACWGGDSKATWSYSQAPKQSEIASTPAVDTFGQSFVLDGGFAQHGYDYATGAELPRGVLIAAQRGNQSLMFAVAPGRRVGDFPANKVVFRARADGSANPFDVVIDGSLRTLKSCNVGGITVVCF